MKTIEQLAQETHEARGTKIPYSGLTEELKNELRSKAAAQLQADEMLDVICKASGQEPDEVHAMVDALRVLGYLRDLPPLKIED